MTARLGRAGGLLLVLWCSGCSTLNETHTVKAGKTTTTSTAWGYDPKSPGVLQLDAAPAGDITARASTTNWCVRDVSSSTEQFVHVERKHAGAWWAVPVIGMVGGVSLIGLTASGTLGASSSPSFGALSQDQVYFALGGATFVAGLTWLIVELVRGLDSTSPTDPLQATTREREACERSPLANASVVLTQGDAPFARLTLDARGKTSLGAERVRQVLEAGATAAARDERAGTLLELRLGEEAAWAGATSPAAQDVFLARFPDSARSTSLREQRFGERVVSATSEFKDAVQARRWFDARITLRTLKSWQAPTDAQRAAQTAAATAMSESLTRELTSLATQQARAQDLSAARSSLKWLDDDALRPPSTHSQAAIAAAEAALSEAREKCATQSRKDATTALRRRELEVARKLAWRAQECGADVEDLTSAIDLAADEPVLAEWRRFIKKCAQLTVDANAFDRISSCDSNCQKIREKVATAARALTDARPENPNTEEGLRAVAQMCERSTCGWCHE